MSELKQKLSDTLINPITRNRSDYKTVALVVAANESSNTCNLKYFNHNGNPDILKNVMVDLRNGQEWFPQVNELVVAEISPHGTGVIISKYIEDYSSEIKGKKVLKNDVSADGTESVVGGSII